MKKPKKKGRAVRRRQPSPPRRHRPKALKPVLHEKGALTGYKLVDAEDDPLPANVIDVPYRRHESAMRRIHGAKVIIFEVLMVVGLILWASAMVLDKASDVAVAGNRLVHTIQNP